jgi:serine/threonine protein kinase/tetratricopeptide (TPR) repeat protein
MIDSTVSHYHILERLGGGGMGVVYKARDLRLNNLVALKFLPPEFSLSKKAKKRFIHEAQAAASLDHQNICVIHDIDETDDQQIFICMNYYEGETLKKRLERDIPPFKETIGIAIQIARGLNRAHEAGIIHRDIKPANIMLTNRGEVKIVDFGLAKLAGQSRLTKTHGTVGTLTYMSPEQTRGEEVDTRSDIWSLGVLVYELVTGQIPFQAEYEAAVLYSILNEDINPPSSVNFEIKPELEEIIFRALQKKPADRFESMQDMLSALIHCAGSAVDSGDKSTNVKRRISWRLKKLKPIRVIAGLIVIATAAIIGGLLWLYTDQKPVSVFIHHFENQSTTADYAPIIKDQLASKLDQSGAINILSRFRISDLRNQLSLDSITTESAFLIARVAKVQVLIQGDIIEVGSVLRLNVRAYDVATKDRLFSCDADGPDADALLQMINQIAVKIRSELPQLPFTAYANETLPIENLSTSIEANNQFASGKDYYYVDQTKAIACFEQAVSIDSTFLQPYLQLAMLYDFLGSTGKALVYAHQAKQLANQHYPRELLKTLAMQTWIERDWDKCIDYLQRSIELQPDDLQSLQRLGYIMLIQKKSYDRALELFHQVAQIDPENLYGKLGPNYNYIGMAHQQKGNIDQALSAFHTYQEISPKKADPLHSLGAACQYFGRYQQAIDYHKAAIDLDPNFFFTYKDLGLVYLSLGRWRDALEQFKRYMAASPKDKVYDAHLVMAEVYMIQRNFAAARHELKQATAYREECIKRCWLAGLIALYEKNDTSFANESLVEMEAALENPADRDNDAYIFHLRGRVALAGGDDMAGNYFLGRAVNHARWEDYYFRKELVKGLLESGRYQRAIVEADSLHEMNGNDAELLVLLGQAQRGLNEVAQANSYFELAREVWQAADDDFLPLLKLDTLQMTPVIEKSNN